MTTNVDAENGVVLLRRAATAVRLREMETTQGRWESIDNGDRLVAWRDDGSFEYVVDEPMSHAANAAWIAFAGPVIAKSLAAWLNSAADVLADYPGFINRGGSFWRFATMNDQSPAFRHSAEHVQHALAVARALLNEEAP